MARELVAYTWCDVCLNQEEPTGPRNEPGQQAGPFTDKGIVLDLCERHRKEFVDPLLHLLAEYGRKADDLLDQRPQPGKRQAAVSERRGAGRRALHDEVGPPWVCKVPDCLRADEEMDSRKTLASHLRQRHDLSMPQYRALLAGEAQQTLALGGPVTPLAGLICPECSKDFNGPEYTVPTRAIAVHRARAHGVRSTKRGRPADHEGAPHDAEELVTADG